MNKKFKPNKDGLVYSTDPEFTLDDDQSSKQGTLSPSDQKLKIRLETKHRAGKTVTLITGFIGTNEDLEDLGKKLKNLCGTGGTVKDGEIIIQGDHRDKVIQWLQKNRYNAKRI